MSKECISTSHRSKNGIWLHWSTISFTQILNKEFHSILYSLLRCSQVLKYYTLFSLYYYPYMQSKLSPDQKKKSIHRNIIFFKILVFFLHTFLSSNNTIKCLCLLPCLPDDSIPNKEHQIMKYPSMNTSHNCLEKKINITKQKQTKYSSIHLQTTLIPTTTLDQSTCLFLDSIATKRQLSNKVKQELLCPAFLPYPQKTNIIYNLCHIKSVILQTSFSSTRYMTIINVKTQLP